jgi:hypothetical protein
MMVAGDHACIYFLSEGMPRRDYMLADTLGALARRLRKAEVTHFLTESPRSA